MNAEKRFHLRRLHRLFGLTAAVGLLWLSFTGLFLVYGDVFELARRPLPGWLARTYGGDTAPVRLAVGKHVLAYDGRWAFDGRSVAVALHAPRLFLPGPAGLYYAVADDGLALFMEDGTLVESLPAATFGGSRLSRAGGDAGKLCAGDTRLRCTTDGAEWRPMSADLPPLSAVTAAEDMPSVERLILDLHAGRFLGPARTLVWTLFSIALLFLAWSGLRLALGKRHKPGVLTRVKHDPGPGPSP